MSDPESSDGQQPESTTEPELEVIDESKPESIEEIALDRAATKEEREDLAAEEDEAAESEEKAEVPKAEP